MTGGRLFCGVSILDVLPDQERKIRQSILELRSDYLLNASEDDLIAALVAEYTFDIPVLDEIGIQVDYGEHQVDVSQDPMRFFRDRSRPYYVAGTRITFVVPFTGDGSLLYVQPQSGIFRLGRSGAEVFNSEIRFTVVGLPLNPEGAKQDFDSELQQIKHNLANLVVSLERHHASLPVSIRKQVQERKAKLLADANMAASIGFPIKRREGATTTYTVPVNRRLPTIDRPVVASGSFKPEPVLVLSEYDEILSIIRNMVHVMERSPKAFEKMGEEDLRTHFLVQLNGQYEGKATGETFNFQGKTDILIREDGKNIFIAECKFWAGEKLFFETINQILSYLSWRDTKVAILIFNRNMNFTEVVNKIAESTPKHPHFKRLTSRPDESTIRCVFTQPNDRNRELTLTVLAFDIPSGRKEAKS